MTAVRLCVLLSLLLPALANAQTRVTQEAQAFMRQHGLRGKVVTTGQTRRLVVPVTPQTADDFARRFSADNGYVRLREGYRQLGTFLFLSLDPGRIYHHQQYERSSEADMFRAPCSTAGSHYRSTSRLATRDAATSAYYESAPAFCFPVSLSADQIGHMRTWLQGARTDPNVQRQWTNCMHYTGNAEVAPGRHLFSVIGASRSIDGPTMIAKLAHGAGPQLEVVARYVRDQAAFDAMGDAALLGPRLSR